MSMYTNAFLAQLHAESLELMLTWPNYLVSLWFDRM